jgi:hypothetical protein
MLNVEFDSLVVSWASVPADADEEEDDDWLMLFSNGTFNKKAFSTRNLCFNK